MNNFNYFLEAASIAGIVLSGFLDYPYNGIVAVVIGAGCICYIWIRGRRENPADDAIDR
jgi:hypothetical protein